MPRIPEETIDEIRDRCNLVDLIEGYTQLKRRGKDYWGCCPFHKEKTPSFKVSPEYQSYYCFGCQKSGNAFRFVMEQENTDFVGAVQLLARRVGVIIPETQHPQEKKKRTDGTDRDSLIEINKRIAEWYQKCLREEAGRPGKQYLEGRDLNDEFVQKFGLGFAPESWDAALKWGQRHGYSEKAMIAAGLAVQKEDGPQKRVYDRFRGRLMFPVWDELGRVVGFSARTIDPDAKTAKYVNTPETSIFHKSKLLYALHMARPAFKEHGCALVCEGQLDTIACHRAGLNHAVAPQGTAFTEQHARMIRRFTDRVVFAFDADAAGQKAAVRSIEVSVIAGLEAEAVILPEGDDPDSIFSSEGAESLQAKMSQTVAGFDFLLRLARNQHPGGTAHDKQLIAEQILGIVAQINQAVARAVHCQWLSAQLGLPEEAVYETLNGIVKRNQRGLRPRESSPAPAATAPSSNQPPAPAAQQIPQEDAKVVAAKAMLLDLAIHDGPIAHQLAENEHLDPEQLRQTPLDKALNLVLRKTIEDDWPRAGAALSGRTDLVGDPRVARVLADSQFGKHSPAEEDEKNNQRREKKHAQAMQDCLLVLEAAQIRGEIDKLQAAVCNPNTTEDVRRELAGRCQVLIKRMSQLPRNGR